MPAPVESKSCFMPEERFCSRNSKPHFLIFSIHFAGVPGCKRGSPYYRLNKGDAACPAGQEILERSECEIALDVLQLCRTDPWMGKSAGIPSYCSHRPDYCNDADWHWNTRQKGTHGRPDTVPICKSRRPGAPPPFIFTGKSRACNCRVATGPWTSGFDLLPPTCAAQGFAALAKTIRHVFRLKASMAPLFCSSRSSIT